MGIVMDVEEVYKANNKRIQKNRIKDKIKQIIFYIWMFILCAILFSFYVTVKAIGWKAILFPVGLLVVWGLITAAVLVFQDRKSIFVKKKAVEEVFLNDSKFGKLKFMRDINDKDSDLNCDALNISFGKYNPEITIRNYKEENQEQYFRSLGYVYEIQNEIINNLYKEATDCCANWEECDDNGNPITYEYIKENFYIGQMTIEMENGDVLITIWGLPGDGLLGDHSINARINCTSKKAEYLLEG